MNLICFPHYTCGGLLCDIMNNTFSEVAENGGIASVHHSLGKIGDADTVLVDYDPEQLTKELQKIKCDQSTWIGTHCWPGRLELSMFDRVIAVTTTGYRSKLYRWTRAYHHYYMKSTPWTSVRGQARVDKERETAKNYLKAFDPVFHPNLINVEFSEIVENSTEFQQLINYKTVDNHLERWKNINKFLYKDDIWNSVPFKRFYEAELECNLNKYYVYQ